MALDGLETKADLERFIEGMLERPGAVRASTLGGEVPVQKVGGISYGSDDVTGDGNNSVTKDVAHDLGKTPAVAVAVVLFGTTAPKVAQPESMDEDSIVWRFSRADDTAATWTNTHTFYWIAVG